MKSGPDQIALPLDWPQSAGDARLILSDANRDAFDHFRKWSMWPVKATILTGPRRSGRTLLARSFVERIAVTPVTSIGLPDDVLFSGLIELLFADRGLHVPGEALRFMVERLERDYWAAERAVEIVDRFAIAERARLTLPTIRRALADAKLIGPLSSEATR